MTIQDQIDDQTRHIQNLRDQRNIVDKEILRLKAEFNKLDAEIVKWEEARMELSSWAMSVASAR